MVAPSSQELPSSPKEVATSDGYYRWADITFEWAKSIDNEYESRAISSLVHRDALVAPNHPLASEDKPVQLFIGEYADGAKQLCYSLRQIQYLQHYIKELDLTNPHHPNNLKQPAESAEDDDKPVRPVPLPAGLIPSNSFKLITTIDVLSDARKIDTKLRKANKKLAKHDALPLPDPFPPAPVPPPPSSTTAPTEDIPLNYFELVQQAVVLARMGGLVGAQREAQHPTATRPELSKQDLATGRALFIAVYAREEPGIDGELILKDAGYHAVFFAEDPNEPGPPQETYEYEHWLVQEEIGFGGGPSPYLYKKDSLTGGSLPIPRDHIKPKFRLKLVDLWHRAGDGPVYFIIHSTDYDASNLFHLGIDITEFGTELGAYGEHSSNGNKFWIDTARIFGEIEHDQPGDLSNLECLTTRSLSDIMTLIYGPTKNKIPSDNAGNSATFTMKIFMNLVQNQEAKSFSEAHAWLAPKLAQRPTSLPSPSLAPTNGTSAAAGPASAFTSALPALPAFPANGNTLSNPKVLDGGIYETDTSVIEIPVDDYDSDCGDFVPMVRDANGNLVPWDDDDDE